MKKTVSFFELASGAVLSSRSLDKIYYENDYIEKMKILDIYLIKDYSACLKNDILEEELYIISKETLEKLNNKFNLNLKTDVDLIEFLGLDTNGNIEHLKEEYEGIEEIITEEYYHFPSEDLFFKVNTKGNEEYEEEEYEYEEEYEMAIEKKYLDKYTNPDIVLFLYRYEDTYYFFTPDEDIIDFLLEGYDYMRGGCGNYEEAKALTIFYNNALTIFCNSELEGFLITDFIELEYEEEIEDDDVIIYKLKNGEEIVVKMAEDFDDLKNPNCCLAYYKKNNKPIL